MTSAKGIGGGFPLGACLATEEAARGMVVGTHGSTYGGNPLAMAAGQAVLDVMTNDEFLDACARNGRHAARGVRTVHRQLSRPVRGVRGKGLMLGIKMKDPAAARDFVAHLRDNHGLLTVAAGDNTFRVLPPLVIDEAISPSSSRSCRLVRATISCLKPHDPAFPEPVRCRRAMRLRR